MVLRISGFELERARVPDAADKRRLLCAIERARKAMPLTAALRVLHLSSSRYHAWVDIDDGCTLDDRPSCPRSKVQRLTFDEVQAIGDMVQSTQHRHVSIRGLALHAQRIGRVFAHPATWSKLIRDRGWRRPRLRLYPAKPKVGLRTRSPNEAWHVDVTILKLLDGTKAYVHAVIDNFSRRILAWTVDDHLDPMNTHAVLAQAAKHLAGPSRADVVMDSGVENLNGIVDQLFDNIALRRVLAQIDVTFSNSLIEAWWRILKHQWLYLYTVDNLATVRKLVAFYVTEHNQTMPHNAFQGQTPDEVYFGRGAHLPDELAARRQERDSSALRVIVPRLALRVHALHQRATTKPPHRRELCWMQLRHASSRMSDVTARLRGAARGRCAWAWSSRANASKHSRPGCASATNSRSTCSAPGQRRAQPLRLQS